MIVEDWLSGWTKAFLGETEEAISRLTHTMRLSPLDPFTFRAQGGIAFAHLLAGRFDESCRWAEMSLEHRPQYLAAIRDLAAAHALAGRSDQAHRVVQRLLELAPSLRMAHVKDWVPFKRPEHLARLEAGLRLAGLPE